MQRREGRGSALSKRDVCQGEVESFILTGRKEALWRGHTAPIFALLLLAALLNLP